jgi:hypothetical protein
VSDLSDYSIRVRFERLIQRFDFAPVISRVSTGGEDRQRRASNGNQTSSSAPEPNDPPTSLSLSLPGAVDSCEWVWVGGTRSCMLELFVIKKKGGEELYVGAEWWWGDAYGYGYG